MGAVARLTQAGGPEGNNARGIDFGWPGLSSAPGGAPLRTRRHQDAGGDCLCGHPARFVLRSSKWGAAAAAWAGHGMSLRVMMEELAQPTPPSHERQLNRKARTDTCEGTNGYYRWQHRGTAKKHCSATSSLLSAVPSAASPISNSSQFRLLNAFSRRVQNDWIRFQSANPSGLR